MNLSTQYLDAFGNITDENGNRYVIKLGSNHYAITFIDGVKGYLLLSGTTITDIILEAQADDNNRAVLTSNGQLIVVIVVSESRSYAIVVDGFTIVDFIELD